MFRLNLTVEPGFAPHTCIFELTTNVSCVKKRGDILWENNVLAAMFSTLSRVFRNQTLFQSGRDATIYTWVSIRIPVELVSGSTQAIKQIRVFVWSRVILFSSRPIVCIKERAGSDSRQGRTWQDTTRPGEFKRDWSWQLSG